MTLRCGVKTGHPLGRRIATGVQARVRAVDLGCMDPQGTWLCPDPAQGARFVDMERRMRPVRNAVFVVMGIGAMILSRHWGWGIVGAFASAVLLITH